MKDAGLLLVTGIIVSAAAWGFWHFLGREAMDVFTAGMLALLTIDNARLRRELRLRS